MIAASAMAAIVVLQSNRRAAHPAYNCPRDGAQGDMSLAEDQDRRAKRLSGRAIPPASPPNHISAKLWFTRTSWAPPRLIPPSGYASDTPTALRSNIAAAADENRT